MLVACAASAASFKWTAANVYGPDGAKYTGAATLYCAQLSDFSQAGTINAGAAAVTFSSDKFIVGNTYDFYFVIDTASGSFTSATKSGIGALQAQTATIGFGNMATATQNPDNWKGGGGDAPEPTSGLLLLIGGAMLALRRKQK